MGSLKAPIWVNGTPAALVIFGVLDQVVGVCLAPIASAAGCSAGRAAERAAIGLIAIGFHVAGSAPGIAIELFDAILLTLLSEPDLSFTTAEGDIIWSGAGAARAIGFNGIGGIGGEQVAQDSEACTRCWAVEQIENLLLLTG